MCTAILTAESVSPEVVYDLVEKGVATLGLPSLMCLMFFGVMVMILKYVVKNHNEQMKTLNEQTQALKDEVKSLKDSIDTLNRGLLDILSRLAMN